MVKDALEFQLRYRLDIAPDIFSPTFCFEVPFSNRLVRVWYQQGKNYLGEFRPLMAIKSKI